MKAQASIRNIAGGAAVAAGVLLIGSHIEAGGREIDSGDLLPSLLIGFALLILGAAILSGSFVGFAARPFTGLIDSIYFGNNPQDPPPLTPKLARAYRRESAFRGSDRGV